MHHYLNSTVLRLCDVWCLVLLRQKTELKQDQNDLVSVEYGGACVVCALGDVFIDVQSILLLLRRSFEGNPIAIVCCTRVALFLSHIA